MSSAQQQLDLTKTTGKQNDEIVADFATIDLNANEEENESNLVGSSSRLRRKDGDVNDEDDDLNDDRVVGVPSPPHSKQQHQQNSEDDDCVAPNSNSNNYTSFGETLEKKSNSSSSSNNAIDSDKKRAPFTDSTENSSSNSKNRSGSLFSSVSSVLSGQTNLGEASSQFATRTASSFGLFKQWTNSAYKCTKQIVSEKLGTSPKTCDPELESSISNLKELKKKYEQILTLSTGLTAHFVGMVQTQRTLAISFSDLAQKSPELSAEFSANSQTQSSIIEHGETLVQGIRAFTAQLSTLCAQTIEDTLITARNYEAARLEYDANRNELERVMQISASELGKTTSVERQLQLSTAQSDSQRRRRDSSSAKVTRLETELVGYKSRYEQLRQDVSVKLKLLDENRVDVMRKQLTHFQDAMSSYFTSVYQSGQIQDCKMQLEAAQKSSATEQIASRFESFLEQEEEIEDEEKSSTSRTSDHEEMKEQNN